MLLENEEKVTEYKIYRRYICMVQDLIEIVNQNCDKSSERNIDI